MPKHSSSSHAWSLSGTEEVICSCQADHNAIIRPKNVSLHNATDHWRPVMQRFVRSTQTETGYLKAAQLRGHNITRGYVEPTSLFNERQLESVSGIVSEQPLGLGPSTWKVENVDSTHFRACNENMEEAKPYSTQNSTDGSEIHRKTVNEAEMLDDAMTDCPDEKTQLQQNKPSSSIQDSPTAMPPRAPRSLSNDSQSARQSNLPPSIRDGRLQPSRLLESEQRVSVRSSYHSPGRNNVFEEYTRKPKRMYGKARSQKY